jgi:hypothetical protein
MRETRLVRPEVKMAAAVELWEAEGLWWWTFKDEDLEIPSNHPYNSKHEAMEAARIAYPDVPLHGLHAPDVADRGRVSFAACVLMSLAIWRHYRPGR